MHKTKKMTDWKYGYKIINDKLYFSIIPSVKLKIPQTLFKFYSISKNSVSALTQSYVYAAKPDQLNDIFDCDERLIDTNDNEFLTELYEGIISSENKKLNQPQLAKQFLKTFFYDRIGILSLTESPDNYLMWSYYTNHRGFIVEYDYKEFDFNFHGPFPINYCSKINSIKLTRNNIANAFLYQTNIKTKHWEHEKEWRILIQCPESQLFNGESVNILNQYTIHNQKFYFSKKVVRSVYLGFHFFDRELNNKDSEVSQISKKELLITVKTNKRLKSRILNFLSKRNIDTYITEMNKNRFDLTYTKSKIRKLNQFEYRIYAC